MRYYKPCHDYECQGSGVVNCIACQGTGKIGYSQKSTKCERCDGSGKVSCEICDGKGKVAVGEVLLDATTLVTAIYLINGGRLTPPSLHCLSVLLESILLNERLVFVEPLSVEAKKTFYEALNYLPGSLVKVIYQPSRRCLNWDRFDGISQMVGSVPFENDNYGKNEGLNTRLVSPFYYSVKDIIAIEQGDSINLSYIFNGAGKTFSLKDEFEFTGLGDYTEWIGDLDVIVDTPLWSYARVKGDEIGRLKALSVARSIMYFRIMHYLNIPYRPDFYRVPLYKIACERINSRFKDISLQLERHIDEKDKTTREKWSNIIDTSESFILHLPLSVISALSKAKNRNDILTTTINLRESSLSRNYREGCQRLEYELFTGENIEDAFRSLTQFEQKFSGDFNESLVVSMDSFPSIAYSFISGIDAEINLSNVAAKAAKLLYQKIKTRNIVFLDYIQKQSRKVKDLNTLCNKLFGKNLDAEELDELARVVGI